jgi:hypothetical protein
LDFGGYTFGVWSYSTGRLERMNDRCFQDD